MKRYRYIVIILLLSPAALLAGEKRIVSINLCTDHFLYLLEERQNITSVSYLSLDSDYSYLASEMSGLHTNNANAEEIIPLQPDLILAGNYGNIQTIHLLRELGYRVEQVDIPLGIQQIDQAILRVGDLLDRKEKAMQLISDMHKRQAIAREKIAGKSKPLAIIVGPNGYTHGKGSIAGDLLEMAGYRNLAAEAGVAGDGNIDIETLVRARPEYLIMEDTASNKDSLAQRFLQHPALFKGLSQMKRISIDPNLWSCGGPAIIDALDILVKAHP